MYEPNFVGFINDNNGSLNGWQQIAEFGKFEWGLAFVLCLWVCFANDLQII